MSNPCYSSPINVAQPPYYGYQQPPNNLGWQTQRPPTGYPVTSQPYYVQQPQTHVVVTECHDHHHGGHHNKSGCDDCCCIASLAVCCACCLACCSD